MTNRTNKDREFIRQLIYGCIEESGNVPTTSNMKEYLLSQGYSTSVGTISAIYRELGYIPEKQPSYKWVKE